MRTRTALALAAVSVLALTGCSSEPSFKDLAKTVERTGYECGNQFDGDGYTSVACGEDGFGIIQFDSASGEVESFDNLADMYSTSTIEIYVIRGEKWRISGDEGFVRKVAEELGKTVTVLGN